MPEVDGVALDPAALATAANSALLTRSRTAAVPAVVRRPSSDDREGARARRPGAGIDVLDGLPTARGPHEQPPDRGAHRERHPGAARPHLQPEPGAGPADTREGYRQAPAIQGGRLVEDYGGGVSQMATTIFNNVFFAGLQDVHHKPHSFYISRYPEGREATVNFPTVDLVWRNDSPYGVLVQASVTGTVNVSFWSTKVWTSRRRTAPGRTTGPRRPFTIRSPVACRRTRTRASTWPSVGCSSKDGRSSGRDVHDLVRRGGRGDLRSRGRLPATRPRDTDIRPARGSDSRSGGGGRSRRTRTAAAPASLPSPTCR